MTFLNNIQTHLVSSHLKIPSPSNGLKLFCEIPCIKSAISINNRFSHFTVFWEWFHEWWKTKNSFISFSFNFIFREFHEIVRETCEMNWHKLRKLHTDIARFDHVQHLSGCKHCPSGCLVSFFSCLHCLRCSLESFPEYQSDVLGVWKVWFGYVDGVYWFLVVWTVCLSFQTGFSAI